MSKTIDLNEILKDPFSNYNDYIQWIKSFKIDKTSIDFIYKLLKKVENDLTYGKYTNAILESKSIGEKPKLFIELLSDYQEDYNIKWLKGNILYKFKLCNMDEIDDKISKLAYLVSRMYQEDFNKEFINEIKKPWQGQDKEIMPYLIYHTTRLSYKYDFTDLFLKINDEYLELLIRNIAHTNVNIKKLQPILYKATSYDKNSADALWYCIYFKEIEDDVLADLCITTVTFSQA